MAEEPYHAGSSVVDIQTRGPYSGGGGPPGEPELEARVRALEDDMKKILQDTAEIKGMLRAAPSAVDFGELKGRVNSLPTTAKVGTLLAIAVAVITIATRWTDFVSALN
jgi:hypothetical protein